jgi:hypothetical protein
MSKAPFDPLRGKLGEFRVALNISEMGDRAFDVLALSQDVGFDKPQFVAHVRQSGVVEVWAVLLQQFHDYHGNSSAVIDPWDEAIDALRTAIGDDHHFNLITLFNFSEYLEPMTAVA